MNRKGTPVETIKHYSINFLIVVLITISLFLSYSFIKGLYKDKPDIKVQQIDSTTFIIKQSTGKTLQIDVQNACGVQGIADKFTDYLRSKGFDVVEMGNFTTQDIKTTMVIDRAGNMSNARKVAQALGISPKFVIQQINKNYFLDATVVIGKDYDELLPFKKTNDIDQ